MTRGKRIYVLDTNVLMHDPTALFKFEEHDVFLPMQVIEELDNAKKGMSEVSRNARQVSRFLDELLDGASAEQIQSGIVLSHPQGIQLKHQGQIGKLHFQTKPVSLGKRGRMLLVHGSGLSGSAGSSLGDEWLCGGDVPNPTYAQVCSGQTGHAEVVQIEFDPKKISYEKVIDLFWKST